MAKIQKQKWLALCLTFLFLSITPTFAADALDDEYRNMEQMMGSIKLEKKQVESMVEKLAQSGRISKEDASKAKREIASLSDNDLENLKNKAVAEVKSKKLLDH